MDCEHISYILNDDEYKVTAFDMTSTPRQILWALLEETPFSVGTVDIEKKVTLRVNTEATRRARVMQPLALVKREIEYYGYAIGIRKHRGNSQTVDIMKTENVKDISYSYNATEQRYSYSGDIVWGYVAGISVEEDQVRAKYISPSTYYDFNYKGKVNGTARNLSDYSDYAVNVYVVHDADYKVITCPIKADGTWESAMVYRETYTVKDTDDERNETGTTHTENVTYPLDITVGEGIKESRLAKGIKGKLEQISSYDEVTMERYVYDTDTEIKAEDGGYGYSYFEYFTVRLHSYSDAEYIRNAICNIWNCGGGKYMWYTNKVATGHKIGKVMQQVWRDGAVAFDAVGIAGAVMNLQKGRLPSSFLIPTDDTQYNKDGSNALGAYGYMLNSRTWAYDMGLVLLVFTTSGDYDICKEMLNRMKYEQNDDGSFNFSYDIYIGQLFDGYVRTGAMGWLVWGACYYTIESGNKDFVKMIKKARNWLVSKRITDSSDPRYGLMTGGYGNYNMEDYSYSGEEIEWCSVGHQCSALQALEGSSLVLKNKKYKETAELVRDSLFLKCYDRENGRLFQGINGDVPDKVWALDCTTWAGTLIFSVVHSSTAEACLETAGNVYLTQNKKIIQSREKDYYNTAYSDDETFSGFKSVQ